MKYSAIEPLRKKLYFTNADLSRELGVSLSSAPVVASRYTKNGFFVKCKRNHYVVRDAWERFGNAELFKTANLIAVPSYISLMTALSFYEVTTQVIRNRIESVSMRRSLQTTVGQTVFTFSKLKKELYSDYIKKEGFFIATPEKALADILYLCSFGKYKADFSAIDQGKISRSSLKSMLKQYPDKTREMAARLWKT